ncbi:hypothetical protein [Mesorhizobium sp. dw_380]|uniref:hypothetical protein n=1 Tax=Mesorhizobium sp. dw_380 TaxID=2812001 RepID=UPI001BDE8289|nr:hypothetical protein [Mesorhizobium sp. dw_380]
MLVIHSITLDNASMRCVKKKRSADTMLFIVGTGTPSSCCSIWNRHRSSVVAVSGERRRNVARRPSSREKRRKFMSSISRWRNGLIEASRTG